MKAMVLNELCALRENQTPLELMELPDPVPARDEILVKVLACGVCHTELDEIEGPQNIVCKCTEPDDVCPACETEKIGTSFLRCEYGGVLICMSSKTRAHDQGFLRPHAVRGEPHSGLIRKTDQSI